VSPQGPRGRSPFSRPCPRGPQSASTVGWAPCESGARLVRSRSHPVSCPAEVSHDRRCDAYLRRDRDPIAHSLSPAIHNAAFGALGLGGVFVAFRVAPERVGDAAAGATTAGKRVLLLGSGGAERAIPFAVARDATPASIEILGIDERSLLAADLAQKTRVSLTASAKTTPGVGMFVHQAAVQFDLWPGRDAPIEALFRERTAPPHRK